MKTKANSNDLLIESANGSSAHPGQAKKWVYFFSAKESEGRAGQKALLGGKGANLAEMCNIGIPVPPGFTISTEACMEYNRIGLLRRLCCRIDRRRFALRRRSRGVGWTILVSAGTRRCLLLHGFRRGLETLEIVFPLAHALPVPIRPAQLSPEKR